jgi:molybdopterin synthase sulfur carrier subunit
MARVTFTPQLERFLDVPPLDVRGETVATALSGVFAANPRLRSYLLDDHGHLRQHVNIFVDGQLIQDRARLTDTVPPSAEIFILQALSGG